MKTMIKALGLCGMLAGTLHCASEEDVAEDDQGTTQDAVNWSKVKAEKPANYRVLTPGVLLAGSHPRPEHLKYLKETGKVKSILSLQSLWQEAVWPVPSIDGTKHTDVCLSLGKCEQKNTEALQMTFFNKPWKVVYPKEVKDTAWVNETMAILADKRNQPVYVHCAYGLDRTGAVIALHRVLNEGKTASEAFQEWRSVRPAVCGDQGTAPKTFIKRMNEASANMRPGSGASRFVFNMTKECAKPQPPPPSGFKTMDGQEDPEAAN